MVHEFVVSWDIQSKSRGCEYSRHYARYFDGRDAALAFARKKEQNPATAWVRIREQESEEFTAPDGCRGVRINVLAFLSTED